MHFFNIYPRLLLTQLLPVDVFTFSYTVLCIMYIIDMFNINVKHFHSVIWQIYQILCHFMLFLPPVQRSFCNSNASFVTPMPMSLSEAITSSDLNQISRKSLLEKGGKGKKKLNLTFFRFLPPSLFSGCLRLHTSQKLMSFSKSQCLVLTSQWK